MNEQRVPLDLHMPKDVYDSLMRQGITQEEIAQQAVQLLSVYCFEQGKLSLNQAAEMAGIDRQRFADLLGSQQPIFVDLDEEAFAQEMATVDEMITRFRQDEGEQASKADSA
jgi:predicted HTH domain antitoxin